MKPLSIPVRSLVRVAAGSSRARVMFVLDVVNLNAGTAKRPSYEVVLLAPTFRRHAHARPFTEMTPETPMHEVYEGYVAADCFGDARVREMFRAAFSSDPRVVAYLSRGREEGLAMVARREWAAMKAEVTAALDGEEPEVFRLSAAQIERPATAEDLANLLIDYATDEWARVTARHRDARSRKTVADAAREFARALGLPMRVYSDLSFEMGLLERKNEYAENGARHVGTSYGSNLSVWGPMERFPANDEDRTFVPASPSAAPWQGTRDEALSRHLAAKLLAMATLAKLGADVVAAAVAPDAPASMRRRLNDSLAGLSLEATDEIARSAGVCPEGMLVASETVPRRG